MEEPDGPAGKVTARDFQCRAPARHQRIDVNVGVMVFHRAGNWRRSNCLGNRGSCQAGHGNREDLPASAHRRAPFNKISATPPQLDHRFRSLATACQPMSRR